MSEVSRPVWTEQIDYYWRPRRRRLSDVLLYYYQARQMQENRRTAFENFYDYYSIPGTNNLDVARIRLQIEEFARMWQLNRFRQGYSNLRYTGFDYEWGADELTSKFVNFIDDGL